MACALAATGCTVARAPSPPTAPAPATTAPTPAPATVTLGSSPTPTPSPQGFDSTAARNTVERLAGLGPREATSEAYTEAAELVGADLDRLGLAVTRQEFPVPAGTSWGIPVPAGTTHNLIADPPGFDPRSPHVVIGAHLDSVPQSPGAEDNASGIAVMLELARMITERPAALPVRFIAFGAEEPRGAGDDRHHHGSRHYVAELDAAERAAIVAMVSLDRVGVPADALPIAHGGRGTDRIARELAEAADVPVVRSTNTTSDHWSFEKAGIPAARLGSVPYAGYHSSRDVPAVVSDAQLARTGGVVWSWLQSR